MHIHILETGRPPHPLDRRFADYPAMFEALLAPHAGRLRFSKSDVETGALPAVSSFDGLLVTGSPAGVYEGHDWIAPAEALIREAAKAGKPQIGVCFGHQLMAQAFGGKVEKSDKGWGVGLHRYRLVEPRDWMTPSLREFACAVSHQDQVVEAPKGARVLAGSDFCPLGFLEYEQGPAMSMQPHPEFAHDYAEALMRLRRERIPEGRVDDGLSSLKQKSDRRAIGGWMANFFTMKR